MTPLILKRASASRSSGQWSDDDYDVLEDGVVVGRISKEPAAPQGRQWGWASGHSAATVKRAAHGYEPTREAAMAAFAKSWRRESVGSPRPAGRTTRKSPGPTGRGSQRSEERRQLIDEGVVRKVLGGELLCARHQRERVHRSDGSAGLCI
jgi:hypothetical protein